MADFLTELEKAIANRLNQLSPEEKKIQSKVNVNRMAQQLSPAERGIAERAKQLSPEERKIQSKVNLDRMGKQQIDIRNAKAQAYLDKKAAEKAPSMASKAGRAFAQAEQGVKKALPKIAAGAKGVLPKLASVARASAPVQAAIEATRTARFLADEDYRDVNQKAYEEMAKNSPLERAVEGGFGGMATILTQAKNLLDTSAAYSRAAESREAGNKKREELIAKGILDEKGRPTRLQEGPVAATEPQDDIRSMVEATGNALSAEPVLDEPTISEPIGNVSTDLGPPKAKPVIDEARMASLFRKTTGTDFNPKSRVDKERMSQLTSFVEQDTDMLNKSDTRIALDFYKTL